MTGAERVAAAELICDLRERPRRRSRWPCWGDGNWGWGRPRRIAVTGLCIDGNVSGCPDLCNANEISKRFCVCREQQLELGDARAFEGSQAADHEQLAAAQREV